MRDVLMPPHIDISFEFANDPAKICKFRVEYQYKQHAETTVQIEFMHNT